MRDRLPSNKLGNEKCLGLKQGRTSLASGAMAELEWTRAGTWHVKQNGARQDDAD